MTLISLAAPAVAGAQSPSPGGLQAPGRPSISAVVCADGHAGHCERGSELRIVGENLDGVERVRFLGRPGRSDDRVARPQQAAPDQLSVMVPGRTRSGPLELRGWSGSARVAAIRITTSPPATVDQNLPDASTADAVFPVRRAHSYGTSINATLGPVALGITAKRTGKRYVFDDNRPTYTGAIGTGTQIYSAVAAPYTLVNLDARVNLQKFGMGKTYFQLNVYNLFNAFYVGGFGGGLTQATSGANYGNPGFVQIGAPRTVSGTINLEF